MTTPSVRAQVPDERLLRTLEARAAAWAEQAGNLLLEQYGTRLTVEFKEKDERSPVTEADRAAETLLRNAISQEFPDHSILGEEGEDLVQGDGAFVWVLDPLDGTTNFINHLPLWAVSIGVLHEGVPVAAAVFTATSHRGGPGVYSAYRGGGARFNGAPLKLAQETGQRASRLVGRPGNFNLAPTVGVALARRPGEPRVLGSIAVELAYAAAGTLQNALFGPPRIWDVAGGVLLVQEAGGLVMESGRNGWLPLHRFNIPPPAKPGDAVTGVAGLKRWRSATVVGSPQVVGEVISAMPSFQLPLWRRAWWWLRRRVLRRRRPQHQPGR